MFQVYNSVFRNSWRVLVASNCNVEQFSYETMSRTAAETLLKIFPIDFYLYFISLYFCLQYILSRDAAQCLALFRHDWDLDLFCDSSLRDCANVSCPTDPQGERRILSYHGHVLLSALQSHWIFRLELYWFLKSSIHFRHYCLRWRSIGLLYTDNCAVPELLHARDLSPITARQVFRSHQFDVTVKFCHMKKQCFFGPPYIVGLRNLKINAKAVRCVFRGSYADGAERRTRTKTALIIPSMLKHYVVNGGLERPRLTCQVKME